MSAITQQAAEILSERRAQAIKQLNKIAHDDALGKASRSDSDQFASLLLAAGWTVDKYTEILELHQRIITYQDQDDGIDKATKRAKTAKIKLDKYRDETERIIESRNAELHRLEQESKELNETVNRKHSASRQLSWIKYERNADLGGDPMNVDEYQLQCDGTVCSIPFDGPVMQLPPEAFAREWVRRRNILKAAREDAISSWKQTEDYKKYKSDEQETIGLSHIYRKWFDNNTSPPPFTEPTWRSLLDAGLIKKYEKDS